MSFRIPSLTELRGQASTVLGQALGSISLPRFSNLRIIAETMAGFAFQHYAFQAETARQILPDTSNEETLHRQGGLFGLVPLPASLATGTATFTGSAGLSIPTDASLSSPVGQYKVLAGGTFVAETLTLAVEAITAGSALNADPGDGLTLDEAIAGVEATAQIVTMAGGEDAEDVEAFRVRVLERYRQPPYGGAAHDYVAAAKTVSGVSQVWVTSLEMGLGTVTVRIMMVTGFPDAENISDVVTAINLTRPVTAEVFVVSPIAQPIDVTISGLSPDTPEIRQAINDELVDALYRRAAPGVSTSVSWISEAVSLAAGEGQHVLLSPTTDIAATTPGHLAVLGTVTYA